MADLRQYKETKDVQLMGFLVPWPYISFFGSGNFRSLCTHIRGFPRLAIHTRTLQVGHWFRPLRLCILSQYPIYNIRSAQHPLW
jgi:hypothetical protein